MNKFTLFRQRTIDDLQFPDKCYQLYAKNAKNADDLQFPDKCYQLYAKNV